MIPNLTTQQAVEKGVRLTIQSLDSQIKALRKQAADDAQELATLRAEIERVRGERDAAEAEITRLKEGMEAAEGANDRLMEMVEKLVLNAITGSVPRAIIVAAGDLLDTLSQEQS